MKPETTAGAILEGQPRWVRTKRLARFLIDTAWTVTKSSSDLEASRQRRIDKDNELRNHGRGFVNALRGNFGDSLRSGIVVLPDVDEPYSVIVEAKTDDTSKLHSTTAALSIISPEGKIAQLVVDSTEPTRAGKRSSHNLTPQTRVAMTDQDPSSDKIYGSLAYNEAEQDAFSGIATHVMSEVTAACDRGSARVYEHVT